MGKGFRSFVIFTFLLCALKVSAEPVEIVPVWTYHATPPFVIDAEKKTGLSFDLAKLLSERSNGAKEFHVEILPRVRLNERLETGAQGIALWVNSAWFDNEIKVECLWSSGILRDKNAVISPIARPVEYKEPSSFIGKRLVAVLGHQYQYIDELVNSGDITRLDVTSHEAAVLSIASGHTDISILANSTAVYYVEQLELSDKIHFSHYPHTRFQRRILVPSEMQDVFELVEEFASGSAVDAQWQTLLDKYNLGSDYR